MCVTCRSNARHIMLHLSITSNRSKKLRTECYYCRLWDFKLVDVTLRDGLRGHWLEYSYLMSPLK